MSRRYYSYTQGNGPWHICGARPEREAGSRAPHFHFDGIRARQLDSDLMDGFGPFPMADHSVYSDRMFQWDSEKYRHAKQQACGDAPFYHCTEEQLSQFLSLYFGKTQEFVALWQGNNASSGFEYWIFFYNDELSLEGDDA